MTKATAANAPQEQETKQAAEAHSVFNKVAGIAAEIAQPSAKAMVKLAPKLAIAGLVGLEALPFVAAATVAGAAIGVGLQYVSRHQQATTRQSKPASP